MAVLANLIFFMVKAAIFAGIAYAGIVFGKKFRDKKELQKSK